MKEIMLKFVVLFTFCSLLLFRFTSQVTACGPPDCGECEGWNGEECVPYGDCWGGCPDCESCCDSWDCEHCVSGGCEPCLKKASDYEELMECSNIVDDPDTEPQPNGCSVPPIICVLPDCDNPAGCEDTSFLGACNEHDECYQTCNSNRDSCDNDFLGEVYGDTCTGMLCICANSSCAPKCSEFAYAYYGAVHNYGEPYWEDDQVDACACCDCN